MSVSCVELLKDQGRIQGLRESVRLKAMFRVSVYITGKDGRDQEKR